MQTSFKSFLISVYIWSIIILTMLPLFIIYMAIWIVVFPFDRKNRITHYFMALWTRIYLTCNPGWKLHIENREKINRNKTYILISNHQSMIDIALLLQLRINFKWVSKVELAKVPFVGWVIWMNNHILVKRGDKKSVIKMAEACNRTLASGTSIFMFPEGTRGNDTELQPFKEGAFIMAVENRIPILPIIIEGSGKALPRKGFWFKLNQNFTVRVLDEIDENTVQHTEVSKLMLLAKDRMTAALWDITKQEENILFMKTHKKIMKKIGFSGDIDGIIQRYINVGDAWEDHLNHCRKFILAAARKRKIRHVAVYGSGWLLDLPLEELSRSADEVLLYDVVHPPQILHKISQYPNVKAITADITGGVINAVYNAVENYKRSGIEPDIPSLFCKQFVPEKEPDFIISLNILSQIGDIISAYLIKHIPMKISSDEISGILQMAHLQLLQQGKSCLITDVQECLYDPDNRLWDTKKLVHCSLPVSSVEETWDWQFDPLGEYNTGMKTVSKVKALEI